MGKRGEAVLAIDIDTRFVEPLAGDTIEDRQHRLPLPRLRRLQVVVREPAGCRVKTPTWRPARFAQELRVQPPLIMAGIGRR
jgi:hypothetical protein